ncbi:hypothetical protein HK101_007149, partial [Irineochytrium annulatum]
MLLGDNGLILTGPAIEVVQFLSDRDAEADKKMINNLLTALQTAGYKIKNETYFEILRAAPEPVAEPSDDAGTTAPATAAAAETPAARNSVGAAHGTNPGTATGPRGSVGARASVAAAAQGTAPGTATGTGTGPRNSVGKTATPPAAGPNPVASVPASARASHVQRGSDDARESVALAPLADEQQQQHHDEAADPNPPAASSSSARNSVHSVHSVGGRASASVPATRGSVGRASVQDEQAVDRAAEEVVAAASGRQSVAAASNAGNNRSSAVTPGDRASVAHTAQQGDEHPASAGHEEAIASQRASRFEEKPQTAEVHHEEEHQEEHH